MYYQELKQALYLSNAYSIENLKSAYIREAQLAAVGQKLESFTEYSLLEIFNNLAEFGLSDSELIASKSLRGFLSKELDKPMEKFAQNLSSEDIEDIDELIKAIDAKLKKLDDKENRRSKNRKFKNQMHEKAPLKSNEGNHEILKEFRNLAPKVSFTQAYVVMYLKTILWCFMDTYNETAVCDGVSLKGWKEIIVGATKTSTMAQLFLYIFEIISLNGQPSAINIFSNIITISVLSCKQIIRQNLKGDTQRTSFSSDDLECFRLYGQMLSFFVAISTNKMQRPISYKEEAISYIAYFLADGFLSQKESASVDAVSFAKRGLKITDPSDRQKSFNILGVSAIDCGQKQLAYDTFFSWINRCIVGELKDLVPYALFQSDDEVAWRENKGKNAMAIMEGNFAYVCGKICDTYEPNSMRWETFHKIALEEISNATKLDPENPNYHCTYGTLLSEEESEIEAMLSLSKALEQFELYSKYSKRVDDKLDSLRVYCDTLLDVLLERFVQQREGSFSQYAEDKNTERDLSNLNTCLKRYQSFPIRENVDNRSLIKAQEKREHWKPYFKLQKIVAEYKEIPSILNFELLLVLIRQTVSLLKEQLKRWEYNSTDYYTRNSSKDGDITGRRRGIKPIVYYTTLNTVKCVFDDLYQETPNQAPRKVKAGENGKNCLTVMHAKYMNDPHEGSALIQGFLTHISKSADDNILFPSNSPTLFRERIYTSQFIFLKSFTERIDNLVMWNRYASDYDSNGKTSNGCCVQLDAEIFGQLVESLNRADVPIKLENTPEDDYYLYRVVYISRDGEIKNEENPGLPSKVKEYYKTLQILICTLNRYLCEERAKFGNKVDELVAYATDFLQQTLNIIIFLFKDSDYSDELESRLILVRTPNQQDSIRLLPTSPEKICINPFFQVFLSQIMFGPNVREQELWTPYLQYQLNKMWKKHPSLSGKPEIPPYTRYSIENSKIHYHT